MRVHTNYKKYKHPESYRILFDEYKFVKVLLICVICVKTLILSENN